MFKNDATVKLSRDEVTCAEVTSTPNNEKSFCLSVDLNDDVTGRAMSVRDFLSKFQELLI